MKKPNTQTLIDIKRRALESLKSKSDPFRIMRSEEFKLTPEQQRFVKASYAEHRYIDMRTDCWLWQRNKSDPKGKVALTPQLWLDGSCYNLNRIAWALQHGSVPKGRSLRANCKNAKCFNPAHHELIMPPLLKSVATNAAKAIVKSSSQNDTVKKLLKAINDMDFALTSAKTYVQSLSVTK